MKCTASVNSKLVKHRNHRLNIFTHYVKHKLSLNIEQRKKKEKLVDAETKKNMAKKKTKKLYIR